MDSTNTLKTRIQLKSDTETNWNKLKGENGSTGFVPLLGEFIVYTPDVSHNYSRLKVGDGHTNVVDLPFVDAGTINGMPLPEEEVLGYENYESFPVVGDSNKLYIDLSTDVIYCYTNNKYVQLSNFDLNVENTTVSYITRWFSGRLAEFTCSRGVLQIKTGMLPELLNENYPMVRTITKEGTV